MATIGDVPVSARVVVIGGGVAGAGVGYHVAELGERDVVVLERSELPADRHSLGGWWGSCAPIRR